MGSRNIQIFKIVFIIVAHRAVFPPVLLDLLNMAAAESPFSIKKELYTMRRKPALLVVMLLVFLSALVLGNADCARAEMCGNTQVQCWAKSGNSDVPNLKVGEVTVDACYNASAMSCAPCNADLCVYISWCNNHFPKRCNGKCNTYWLSQNTGHRLRCGPSGWWP